MKLAFRNSKISSIWIDSNKALCVAVDDFDVKVEIAGAQEEVRLWRKLTVSWRSRFLFIRLVRLAVFFLGESRKDQSIIQHVVVVRSIMKPSKHRTRATEQRRPSCGACGEQCRFSSRATTSRSCFADGRGLENTYSIEKTTKDNNRFSRRGPRYKKHGISRRSGYVIWCSLD